MNWSYRHVTSPLSTVVFHVTCITHAVSLLCGSTFKFPFFFAFGIRVLQFSYSVKVLLGLEKVLVLIWSDHDHSEAWVRRVVFYYLYLESIYCFTFSVVTTYSNQSKRVILYPICFLIVLKFVVNISQEDLMLRNQSKTYLWWIFQTPSVSETKWNSPYTLRYVQFCQTFNKNHLINKECSLI